MYSLTDGEFEELKHDYPVYATNSVIDGYGNEQRQKAGSPRGVIHTMWHPLTDSASIAEYGEDISRMFYCIMYDDPGVNYGDVVEIRGMDYDVVGLKFFNLYTRVEVKRQKVKQ